MAVFIFCWYYEWKNRFVEQKSIYACYLISLLNWQLKVSILSSLAESLNNPKSQLRTCKTLTKHCQKLKGGREGIKKFQVDLDINVGTVNILSMQTIKTTYVELQLLCSVHYKVYNVNGALAFVTIISCTIENNYLVASNFPHMGLDCDFTI